MKTATRAPAIVLALGVCCFGITHYQQSVNGSTSVTIDNSEHSIGSAAIGVRVGRPKF